MFEFSIAKKYLLPNWRQLSVSIISLISVAVISLVVWLILVFFSVTTGLEKIWVEKLIALTAPVRILPTEEYYQSYYYLIDSISSDSDYTLKSLSEKLQTPQSDPYNPLADEELPLHMAAKDLNPDGSLKDLVKMVYSAINNLKGYESLRAQDYEMTFANIRLRLLRGLDSPYDTKQSFLSQAAYLGSFDNNNSSLSQTLLPLSALDLANVQDMLFISQPNQEESPDEIASLDKKSADKRLQAFLNHLNLDSSLAKKVGPEKLLAALAPVNDKIFENDSPSPAWVYRTQNDTEGTEYHLPKDPLLGDGVLLPKSYREGGVLVGDRGYIAYYAPTTSTVQEQRVPIFVAGFYDPGIVPIGGKYILASKELTNFIRASHNQEDLGPSNGINLRFKNLHQAEALKRDLQKALENAGVAKYWKIETFQEYDFTKDLLHQLRSEKNIFSLIAAVIIIVACSNIVSMLIILVNDKRVEIGILRSMGANSTHIATIFGACGLVMGLIGSVIGTSLAFITLKNLQTLIDLISRAQGFQAFNPLYFGNTLPNQISSEALTFVLVATTLTSLIAGLIPAIKASTIKPSAILRSE